MLNDNETLRSTLMVRDQTIQFLEKEVISKEKQIETLSRSQEYMNETLSRIDKKRKKINIRLSWSLLFNVVSTCIIIFLMIKLFI